MIFVDRVVGSCVEPALADRLRRLEQIGRVDVLPLPSGELERRRFRATSEAGEQVTVALPEEQKLFDGAVLLLKDDSALVVRVDREHWLRIEPRSLADAVELGYHAGNLRWRVRFQGEALLVALEAPVDHYLERLGPLVAERRIATSVLPPE
jgi:urease accessory protein